MALRIERVEDWLGQTVVDPDGEKIGKLEDIVFAADGTPLFGAVSTGLFGRHRSLVPIGDAGLAPDHVTVRHPKSRVKDAPRLDDMGEMSGSVEDAVDAHYNLPSTRDGRADPGYTTGSERLELARRADAAGQRANELEALAEERRVAAREANADLRAARARADELNAAHEEAVREAREARAEQALLDPNLPDPEPEPELREPDDVGPGDDAQ